MAIVTADWRRIGIIKSDIIYLWLRQWYLYQVWWKGDHIDDLGLNIFIIDNFVYCAGQFNFSYILFGGFINNRTYVLLKSISIWLSRVYSKNGHILASILRIFCNLIFSFSNRNQSIIIVKLFHHPILHNNYGYEHHYKEIFYT
jgi:hypothetical protein